MGGGEKEFKVNNSSLLGPPATNCVNPLSFYFTPVWPVLTPG